MDMMRSECIFVYVCILCVLLYIVYVICELFAAENGHGGLQRLQVDFQIERRMNNKNK